jgi:SSS family solute:Na+ symporter
VKFPTYLTVEAVPITKNVTFLISTIIFQAVGFYVWPSIMQYVFSAKSEKTIRHNQCIMPVYMLMYVFLVTAAFFTLVTVPGLKNPDDAFMGMIVRNVPSWLVGVVAAGGALTCILVLADVSLAVGGIVSRNIVGIFKPDLASNRLVRWTRFSTALFLAISVCLTIFFPRLLLGLITISYFGITQIFPGIVATIVWKRATKWGVAAGMIVGVFCVFLFNTIHVVTYGINKGLLSVVINAAVMVVVTLMTKPDAVAIERFMLTVKSDLRSLWPAKR